MFLQVFIPSMMCVSLGLLLATHHYEGDDHPETVQPEIELIASHDDFGSSGTESNRTKDDESYKDHVKMSRARKSVRRIESC